MIKNYMQVKIMKYINDNADLVPMEAEDFATLTEETGGYAGASTQGVIASFDDSELEEYDEQHVYTDKHYSNMIYSVPVYKCYNNMLWVPLEELANKVLA